MKKRGKWNIAKLWKNKHIPKGMREKISRTKKRLYKEGKIKPSFKGAEFTKQHRKNISLARIAYYRNNPKKRRRIGIERREFFERHPKVKQRMIAKLKRRWTKAKREKWSEKTKRLYEKRPEVLRRIRASVIQYNKAHPNQSKLFGLKTWFHLLVDKKARERVQRNWRSPYKRTIHSAVGKVRSKYEKKTADCLIKYGYKAEYETKRLFFEGYESNPDFFVTDKKDKVFMCIVEVYGLHYMAEKKKREKQYYYKKYKLPVIGITPAETYNLEYYLIKEIGKMKHSKYAAIAYIKRFENPLYTIKQSKNYGKLKKMLKENPELRKEARKILRMIRVEKKK